MHTSIMRDRLRLVFSVVVFGIVSMLFAGCETTSGGGSGTGIIGSYDLRFGVMLPSSAGPPAVVQEATEVERIVDQGYAHGFTVRRKGGGRFMLSYAVRFPVPLPEADQGLSPSGRFSEGGRVYTSEEKMVWDIGYQAFFFSESDPLGIYELSIYIDGELYQMIPYNVIEPRLL